MGLDDFHHKRRVHIMFGRKKNRRPQLSEAEICKMISAVRNQGRTPVPTPKRGKPFGKAMQDFDKACGRRK
jgi:hypothetical protein